MVQALTMVKERFGLDIAAVVHLAAYFDFLSEPSSKYGEIMGMAAVPASAINSSGCGWPPSGRWRCRSACGRCNEPISRWVSGSSLRCFFWSIPTNGPAAASPWGLRQYHWPWFERLWEIASAEAGRHCGDRLSGERDQVKEVYPWAFQHRSESRVVKSRQGRNLRMILLRGKTHPPMSLHKGTRVMNTHR